jgi:hypothetical protein
VPESQPRPQPPTVVTPGRATRPALLYVLAAFGVVAGGYGSLASLTSGLTLLQSREVFVQTIQARDRTLETFIPKGDLERFSQREGQVRYARRNAALPLAAVGVILSCLLFAGCARTMMGDPWGLGAWSLAAAASIPYHLITTALILVTTRDVAQAVADSPVVPLLPMERLGAMVMAGLAIAYYGACLLYLRSSTVRSRFSGGEGRTPPSA